MRPFPDDALGKRAVKEDRVDGGEDAVQSEVVDWLRAIYEVAEVALLIAVWWALFEMILDTASGVVVAAGQRMFGLGIVDVVRDDRVPRRCAFHWKASGKLDLCV